MHRCHTDLVRLSGKPLCTSRPSTPRIRVSPAGSGTYRHYSEPFTPANTDIVTPNNDTPYSWGWFDLRAEPWVITVPAIDRFYILPFHDLYTVYAGYVSAATTGTGPGSYLLAGPTWTGDTPEGFDGVITASTDFVGCLGRTAFTDGDVDELRRIQQSYAAVPLSEHMGAPAPAAEPVSWPTWDEAAATDIRFYDYLDHLLQFAPVAGGRPRHQGPPRLGRP